MSESMKANGSETTVDLAVAQMLALAKAANVSFDLAGDRLVIRSTKINWKLWPPVRHYLDELGVDAIAGYFKRNTPQDRAALSASA